MALGNGNGDLFVIIMFLAIELVFIKFAYFFVIVFGSSVFNIILYNDKFEFKRIFRNKTFYYTDVELLTEISPLTGFIQNREGKIRIIEIKFKNKKTIHMLIKVLANEKEKGLRYDLEKYIKMPMELTCRSIYSIK